MTPHRGDRAGNPLEPTSGVSRRADAFDVVVIQKQTALERYTRRALNVDFLEYVEQGGGSLENLKVAHDDHVAARRVVVDALASRGLTAVFWNLDELASLGTPVFRPDTGEQGLRPRRKLVVSLGGDGTLLHASHYVGGDVVILGVNSCPPHSVGALCAATRETFPSLLDAALSGDAPLVETRRLLVRTSENHLLPLALNDVLLCNQHPAATSRYQISVTASQAEAGAEQAEALGTALPLHTEGQLSSGLWVAAPAGTSAAIRGYGLPPLPLDSPSFHVAVREPYNPPQVGTTTPTPYALERFTLNGDVEALSLFCRMRTGLVCVDGPDNGCLLGFGVRIEISMPQQTTLRLIPRS
jgi:NAD+ kinase